ncbi:KpsF/GutQ family sugar-phosphate isomerase [Palleronia sp. KMU-117]|uniref:KpsF/GutQ family sugar-phosphate isomerase n=1 Tax=Palleronia sp. KMU-117 TaxID=3434108 RepID=UPI003D72C08F
MSEARDIAAHLDRALSIDVEGLSALRAAMAEPPLRDALARTVELLLGLKGRLVVSGLGKSGHVGRKLAATFASTGTPSYFVHGAEASHGDLGVIQDGDVVLILTWSGTTQEMTDIVGYTRRFGIPLIAITGNGAGRVAREADICLELPKVREACPLNLAPTTSTLMQMAVGDAIAVTLLHLRGFSETSFRDFHPGGRLGAGLTSIDRIMATGTAMPIVAGDTSVSGVVDELSAKSLGIVGVVDAGGRLAGVITDGDIRRYLGRSSDRSMREALHETRAEAIMTRDPVALAPGILAAQALNILQNRRISAAFILDDSKPAGVITTLQLLQAGVG